MKLRNAAAPNAVAAQTQLPGIQKLPLLDRFTSDYHMTINKRPDLWGSIERQLELIPGDCRVSLVWWSWSSLLDRFAPDIPLATVSQITSVLEACPAEARAGFFAQGVVPILSANPGIKPGNLGKILSDAAKNMSLPTPGFLQGHLLKLLKADFSGSCSDSKSIFMDALDSGTLIKTRQEFGLYTRKGWEVMPKNLYIKGFFSYSGEVLAFEPDTNSIYIVEIKPGKGITDVELEFQFRADLDVKNAILAREEALKAQAPQP